MYLIVPESLRSGQSLLVEAANRVGRRIDSAEGRLEIVNFIVIDLQQEALVTLLRIVLVGASKNCGNRGKTGVSIRIASAI